MQTKNLKQIFKMYVFDNIYESAYAEICFKKCFQHKCIQMPSSMAGADKTSSIFQMFDHLAILTIFTRDIKTWTSLPLAPLNIKM